MGQLGVPAPEAGECEIQPEPTRRRRGQSDPRMERLVRTVETEIVPRLLLARRNLGEVPVPANSSELDAGDAAELARLLLAHEVEIPFAYVEAIRHRGVPVQHIYTQLLAPAARRLGLLWERDECDFMQVTVGLGRLHQLLQRLASHEPEVPLTESRGHGRRVLLSTLPGEDHTFGLLMVSQFFIQNGWEVWNEFPATADELAACASQQSFAVIGLSVATSDRLDQLTALIRKLRRCSANPAVGIMVGGPVFQLYPELVSRVGADATATDAREATLRAEGVCALIAGER